MPLMRMLMAAPMHLKPQLRKRSTWTMLLLVLLLRLAQGRLSLLCQRQFLILLLLRLMQLFQTQRQLWTRPRLLLPAHRKTQRHSCLKADLDLKQGLSPDPIWGRVC